MDYFSSAISGNPCFLGQHCITVGFDYYVFHISTMDEEMFFGSTATPKQFMKVSVAFAKIYSALENLSRVISKQEGITGEKQLLLQHSAILSLFWTAVMVTELVFRLFIETTELFTTASVFYKGADGLGAWWIVQPILGSLGLENCVSQVINKQEGRTWDKQLLLRHSASLSLFWIAVMVIELVFRLGNNSAIHCSLHKGQRTERMVDDCALYSWFAYLRPGELCISGCFLNPLASCFPLPSLLDVGWLVACGHKQGSVGFPVFAWVLIDTSQY